MDGAILIDEGGHAEYLGGGDDLIGVPEKHVVQWHPPQHDHQ